ncbi:hypothetical protein [Haloarcula halophila]|uniref:hypothetical protein n=1 Tax=Haloarcula TaxID=2237 RepID=UPI0023E3B676|nr:hypothetical protein [Halomicroarcula sp. DFY41]
MNVTFEPLAERPGIDVIDCVERQRYQLRTAESVSPQPADADSFRFPVSRAVTFETDSLVLPTVVPVYVRDADGETVAEVKQFEQASVPAGDYSIDLCTQIKTYVRVEAAVEVSVDMDQTRIEFDAPTTVAVGARSRHERPAATVTTTTDPMDMLAAIETFGSALKTTDPERSYPTLRGHPPALELGDSLDIPETITRPETGITLELPPTLSAAFVAAPLAYYLGASLEPAPTPRLTTDDGFEYSLSGPDGYERTVEQTLKQLFFFDCVTRTEGYYELDLHERREIEPLVDIDFATLYDRPLTEQVAAYLDVPYELVADHVPEWRLTTHIDPVAANAEQLPFVVDDLAIVRTRQGTGPSEPSVPAELDGEFTRDDVITRSTSTGTDTEAEYVEPGSADTLEQAWIGDSIPIGASKLTADAFRNRLDRDETAGDISITVVQNDARMDQERRVADEVYGNRADLPFDVTVRENLTTDELADVMATETDFFHYIGHTDHEGFTCEDGKLDAATVDTVGVDTFLLNACNSYHQGLTLIENGAIGGIVTLNEILNDAAIEIGSSTARLLNSGFPLRTALTVSREVSPMGGQYIVVGDGGITVTQAPSGTPNLLDITECDAGYEAEIVTYATDDRGLGSVFMPFVDDNQKYFLSSGSIDTFHVSHDELLRFLNLEEVPVRIADKLYWSTSAELRELL